MFRRRLLYVAGLVAAAFYYIFDSRYFSWILLLILLALPVLSLLSALPFLFGRYIQMKAAADRVEVGEAFEVSVVYSPPWQLGKIKMGLRFENRFTGEKTKHKMIFPPGLEEGETISFVSSSCGVLRVRLPYPRTVDPMGLIPLPMRRPKSLEIIVLPVEIPFTEYAVEELVHENKNPEKTNLMGLPGERDFQDVREYRYGDSLRDIHWKLTARQDKLIVREYTREAGSVVTVAVPWYGTLGSLEKSLARYLGLVKFLGEEGQLYVTVWPGIEDQGRQTLWTPGGSGDLEMERLLWRILSKSPESTREDVDGGELLEREGLAGETVLLLMPGSTELIGGENTKGAGA